MVSLLWCSSNQGCKVDGIPSPFKRLFLGTEPIVQGFPLEVTLNGTHMSLVRPNQIGAAGQSANSRGLEPMKNLIILAVVAAVGIAVWLFAQPGEAPETASVETPSEDSVAPAEAAEVENTPVAEDTTTSVIETVEEAADEAVTAVDEAVSQVADAVETALDTATSTAEEAIDNATGASSDANEAAADALEGVVQDGETEANDLADPANATAETTAEKAEDVIEGAANTLNDAAEAAAPAVESDEPATESTADDADATTSDPDIAELLTADGFDFEKVVAYIDESNLSLLIKTSTKAALEDAQNNPEQLKALLATLRDQLGL